MSAAASARLVRVTTPVGVRGAVSLNNGRAKIRVAAGAGRTVIGSLTVTKRAVVGVAGGPDADCSRATRRRSQLFGRKGPDRHLFDFKGIDAVWHDNLQVSDDNIV